MILCICYIYNRIEYFKLKDKIIWKRASTSNTILKGIQLINVFISLLT